MLIPGHRFDDSFSVCLTRKLVFQPGRTIWYIACILFPLLAESPAGRIRETTPTESNFMQPTKDNAALIQTVHGTSLPFLGLARISLTSPGGSSCEAAQQIVRSENSDLDPQLAFAQSSQAG
jgi:hypothetical protein